VEADKKLKVELQNEAGFSYFSNQEGQEEGKRTSLLIIRESKVGGGGGNTLGGVSRTLMDGITQSE